MDELYKLTKRKLIVGYVASIMFLVLYSINITKPLSLFKNSSDLIKSDSKILNLLFTILVIVFVGMLIYSTIFVIKHKLNKEVNYTKKHYDILDLLTIIPLFFAVIIFINTYFLSIAKVTGSSMEPTYYEGNTLIISTSTKNIQRYDILIVHVEEEIEDRLWIKRVVGLPGDKIKIQDNILYINGELITEDYVVHPCVGNYACNLEEIILGEDEYIILGDNRNGSRDSRIIGPISKSEIVGKVLINLN